MKRESAEEEDTKRPFPTVWPSEQLVKVMGDVNERVSEEREVPASTYTAPPYPAETQLVNVTDDIEVFADALSVTWIAAPSPSLSVRLLKTQFVKVACAPFMTTTDFVTVAASSAGWIVMVSRDRDPDVAEKREDEMPSTTVANLNVRSANVTSAPVMLNTEDALVIEVTAFIPGDGVPDVVPGWRATMPDDSSTISTSVGCDAEPMK